MKGDGSHFFPPKVDFNLGSLGGRVRTDRHKHVAFEPSKRLRSRCLMKPLLQLFEFSYPNGHLFLDRGGAVCRRLREVMPALTRMSGGRRLLGVVVDEEVARAG